MRRGRRPFVVYGIVLALLAAGGYLCFELGRFESGYSIIDQRREAAALKQRIRELESDADGLRRQVAILETSREIDRETYSTVEADLASLQAKIQAQEEELVFYRGIVSPQDGAAGLRIQNIEVLPGDAERRYLLRLVLVQAIAHSRRAKGSVKLQLEGLADGQTATFDLSELVAEDGVYDTAYEFRYFQGLEAEFTLPVGFEPAQLRVEVSPSEPRAERVTQSFEWSAIAGSG